MSLGLMGGGRNPTHTSAGRQGDVRVRKTQVDPDPPSLSQVSRYFSLFLALSFLSFSLCADFSISQQMHLSPGGWGVGREGT